MKKLSFETAGKRQWDSFNAFHTRIGPFVLFETGELILDTRPHSGIRRYYSDLGLELVSSTERKLPSMFFDAEHTDPIPQAWLTQHGLQELILDYERGKVLAPKTYYNQNREVSGALPRHLSGAYAVWLGPERDPVTVNTIRVNRPDKEFKSLVSGKLRDVMSAVRAVARLRGIEPYEMSDPLTVHRSWSVDTVEEIVDYICSQDAFISLVTGAGFTYPRADSTHNFLYFKH